MNTIKIETTVEVPIETAWEVWSNPEHITHWAIGSQDWETPHAENDLVVGGKFLTHMKAKDDSASFDFEGVYTTVDPLEKIAYTIADGRKVTVWFEKIDDNTTKVTEEFDPETENSEEMQRSGWQTMLDNYKKYAESEK